MTPNLLLTRLLVKKKLPWLILGFSVILITVVILPLILVGEIEEGNVALGFFMMVLLAFVSTQVDLMFLHKPKLLVDLKSKPISLFEQVMQRTIINVALGLFWMLLLVVITLVMGFDLQEFFAPMIPLMMVIIMVTALSNLLAGTLAFGVLTTIANFMLPLMTVGVVHSVMLLVGARFKELNVSDVMEYVVDDVIPLDKWYFIYYANHDRYGLLILQLVVMMVGLTFLIKWLSRIRAHEKIGDTIVFSKYMYFITFLLATMAGYLFIFAVEQDVFFAASFAFIILFSLVYYVLMAVHHRSFKLTRDVFTRLGVFYIIFFSLVLITTQIMEFIW